MKEEYSVDVDYPLAQFVIVMGFFLILTIEQTVLHFQVKHITIIYEIGTYLLFNPS